MAEHSEEELYEETDKALKKGDLHRAADLCKSLLTSFPKSAHSYYLTSSLFRATGNYRKAYDYSAIASDLDARVAQYHVQQGEMLLLLKEYAESLMAFQRAAAISDTDKRLCRGMANCLMALERFDEAKHWLAKAHGEMGSLEAMVDEAQCDTQAGDYDHAEKLLSQCIAMDPSCAHAHYLLSLLSIVSGEFDRAQVLLRKASSLDGAHVGAHFYLALLLAEESDMQGAADRLLQALSLDPTHVPSLLLLAGLFMQTGNIAESEKAFTHVLALVPDHILAWYSLMELMHDHGRGREAVQRLGEVIAALPNMSVLRHMRALFSGDVPPMAPVPFITAFYEAFFDMFEPWLIASSDAPHVQEFASAIRRLPSLQDKKHLSVLDLGCGTGVLASKLSDISAITVGVDVSRSMLKLARRRKCYDVLYDLDIIEYIVGSETVFDLIVSTGALRWIGNLQPFFFAVRGVMHQDSVLACMFDKELSTLAYSVANHGRYSHHLSYICDVAAAEGLQLLQQKEWVWEADGEDNRIVRHMLFFKKMTVH